MIKSNKKNLWFKVQFFPGEVKLQFCAKMRLNEDSKMGCLLA